MTDAATSTTMVTNNPGLQHVVRVGQFQAALVTDLLDASAWLRHPLREELLRPAGVPYSLMCGYSPRPGVLRGWGINRDRDFTDGEVESVAAFFPYFIRAASNRERVQALEEMSRAVARGGAVLVLSGGQVVHASREAKRLLERHQLPLELRDRYLLRLVGRDVPRVVVRSLFGVLRLRLAPGAASPTVVVLDEPEDPTEQARAVGLTPRQHEVLRLLAQGGTSQAIGNRLGISHRTVQKHLEDIYRRLGVRDRLDAVTQAHKHNLIDNPEGTITHDIRGWQRKMPLPRRT